MRREPVALLAAALLAAAPATGLAGSAGVGVDLLPAGLSVQTPAAVDLPAVVLAGSPVTVEAQAGPVRVVDTRAANPGWTLVASAGRPTDALGRPMDASLVAVPQAASTPPGVRLGDPLPLDVPRTLAEAEPGAGGGAWTLDPRLRLTVPADAPSGVYTATLVVTIS